MAKLYELNEDFLSVQDMLENAEDDQDLQETLQDTLDSIQSEIEMKIEYLVKLQKNFEGEAEMYKAEKDRLAKKQSAAENRVANLKEFISSQLTTLGFNYKKKNKLITSIGKLGFQKNNPSIEIVNLDKIPTEWDKPLTRTVDSIRKKDLLDHIKDFLTNNELDPEKVEEHLFEDLGVKYVNNKSHLRLR